MTPARPRSALELLGFRRSAEVSTVTRSAGETISVSDRGWKSFILGDDAGGIGQIVNQTTAMRVSAVYACVTIRSEDVARCTPRLFRRATAAQPRVEVTDHPVARLLRRPNRVQSWFEFAEQLWVGRLLRGNAYAVILRDRRGNPTELIPVNPDLVTLLEAADGSLFYQISRAGLWLSAVLGAMPYAIPAEDVLHIRGVSLCTLLGAGALGFARGAVGLALAQDEQAAGWHGRGARPSGILTTEQQIDEDQAKLMKADWQRMNGGSGNTGGTAVLTSGLKWMPLQMTSVDQEFMAARSFSVEEICRFFRTPPHKVGQLTRSTNNNIAAQDQDYVNNTIMPDLDRFEGRFEVTFDLAEEGLEVDLDEGALLRADLGGRMNAARIGVMSSLLTPDEGRQLVAGHQTLDLAPKGDWAGELQKPSNMAGAGSQSTGTQPDGGGRRGDGDPDI